MEIEKLIKIHTDAERLSQETTTTIEHEHITFELYGPSLVLDFQHQQVKRGKRNKLWKGLESWNIDPNTHTYNKEESDVMIIFYLHSLSLAMHYNKVFSVHNTYTQNLIPNYRIQSRSVCLHQKTDFHVSNSLRETDQEKAKSKPMKKENYQSRPPLQRNNNW